MYVQNYIKMRCSRSGHVTQTFNLHNFVQLFTIYVLHLYMLAVSVLITQYYHKYNLWYFTLIDNAYFDLSLSLGSSIFAYFRLFITLFNAKTLNCNK